ncbi:hypothetical protein [Paraburkholderia youngii]|uniref:hypothetical protein n=1 Tax=Paraburkholderia youngii TaxID=2782701 RepID=UPI003D1A5BFF
MPTKAELEAEAENLRSRINRLEGRLNESKFTRMKTLMMFATYGVLGLGVLAVIGVCAALGKPNPFNASTTYIFVALGIIGIVGHLVAIAMILKRDFKIKAEISAKRAKLDAIVGEPGTPTIDPNRASRRITTPQDTPQLVRRHRSSKDPSAVVESGKRPDSVIQPPDQRQ